MTTGDPGGSQVEVDFKLFFITSLFCEKWKKEYIKGISEKWSNLRNKSSYAYHATNQGGWKKAPHNKIEQMTFDSYIWFEY